MGTVTNPLSGLIDGLLLGHNLGLQLRKQQMEEQAFKTNQALHDQQMSVQDIMNRQMLQENARPISGAGTIENPAGPDVPSGVPGLPAGPGAPAYVRKPDASRVVKYGGQQYELKTPEEQQTSKLNDQIHGNDVLEQAKYRTAVNQRNNVLQMQGGGIKAQGLESLGIPAGTALTWEENAKYIQEAEGLRQKALLKLGPGDTLVDTGGAGIPSAPGAAPAPPRTIATGGPPNPTGDFERVFLPAFALKQGKTVANLGPDLTMQAVQEYAQKSKDPETVALAHALTQAHLDNIRSQMADRAAKNSTTPTPIDPGTREFKIAQDLAYGRLTMQQFRSLSAYSRDTNKKMDIYDKAAELNPNFNPAAFEMGFKFAGNPKTQQQLASMDNVAKGAEDLLRFSDAASRTGITALNKFVVPGGIALGGKKYSDFHTAQIAFADELSGALGFGGATDMSKQMGIDMTNPNLSPENFKSAVQNVVLPFVERKRKTLLDQMGVYGQPGMNPGAGPVPPPAPQQTGGRGGRGGGQAGVIPGSVIVTDPRGGIHTFPNQKAADAFKEAIGVR